MPGPVFSEGESVALRTVEDEDLEFLQRWRNDPKVRRRLTLDEPSNGEQTQQFFEDAIASDEGASFLVCVADRGEATEQGSGGAASRVADWQEATGDASGGAASSVADRGEATGDASGEGRPASSPDPAGMVSLFREDHTAGVATIAYWVVPDEQGNGYATDAVGLLCEYAFADRRLNKLRADVIESNDGSRRVLEKTGFQREGVLREAKFVGGEHVDVYRYGLLADEWRAA